MAPFLFDAGLRLGVAVPAERSLTETLLFQLGGFAFVMVALTMIYGLLTAIGFFFARQAQPEAAAMDLAAEEKENELSSEKMAVIVAAVAAVIQAPHRIMTVHMSTGSPWVMEGRIEHFASHRIR